LNPELLEVAREIILRNGDINLQNKEEINPGTDDSSTPSLALLNALNLPPPDILSQT